MPKKGDKVLGVLGGMGPAATAEFLRLLTILAPAAKDQDHPVVIVLSNPKIPDRTEAILGRGEDPAPYLKEGLFRLVEWGADLLAVPCNTAHYFIDHFLADIPVPLVHIVHSTVEKARQTSPEGAWLVATDGTRASGIYETYAAKVGYPLFLPEAEVQSEIQLLIKLVKANKMAEAAEKMRRAAEKLWEKKPLPLMTACTETPLAYDAAGLPQEKMVSSLTALAEATLSAIYS